MPDLAQQFPEYDSSDLTTLFLRAYELRNEVGFKTGEYTN
jgi:hypothetical protein